MTDSLFVLQPYSFDIGYRQNKKYWSVQNHYHNDYEIIFVAGGKLQFKIDDKVYIVKKDTLIFINHLETHEYRILEYPYCRHVIMVKPGFIDSFISEPILLSIFKHSPKKYNHLVELGEDQVPEILALFRRMQEEYTIKRPYWESNIKLYLYLLLTAVYRISQAHFPLSDLNSSNKKVITEIQKYIEENFTEDINLTDISRQFHTDMYYLCHLFKEITGYTFRTYLTMRRISNAKELLSFADKDITRVGLDSGFNNANHFIRTFKKFVGVTPFQYKKQIRSGSTSTGL
jgi:AraC-like DNA-binding protein